jgi:hypothetical protein
MLISRSKSSGFLVVFILAVIMALMLPTGPVHAQEGPPVANASIELSFADAAVNGVPLVLVVFGIVAFLKLQGLQGKLLLLCSLGTGLLIGAAYMVYKTRPPTGDWWVVYGYWFGVVMYGLGLGLLASGVYEGGKSAVQSVIAKIVKP